MGEKLFASAIECIEYSYLEECLIEIDPTICHVASPKRTESLLLWDSYLKSFFTCQIVKEALE